MRSSLEERFRNHFLDTISKIPTDEEMSLANKITKEEYEKIYDAPNNPMAATRASYNKVLSRIWPKVVATTVSFSGVVLLSRYVKFKPYYNITSLK